MKLDQIKIGVWNRPDHDGYLLQCCDCGLVHEIDFRIKGKDIEFKVVKRWN